MSGPLTDAIAAAERLAGSVVVLSERERAAWVATKLADPYVRPDCERAHRRARADRLVALEMFEVSLGTLRGWGLDLLADRLARTAMRRCRVAIDIACHDLLAHGKESESDGPEAHLDRDAAPQSGRQAPPHAAGAEMPGVRPADRARPAAGPLDLLRDAYRATEGRGA